MVRFRQEWYSKGAPPVFHGIWKVFSKSSSTSGRHEYEDLKPLPATTNLRPRAQSSHLAFVVLYR